MYLLQQDPENYRFLTAAGAELMSYQFDNFFITRTFIRCGRSPTIV